MRVPWPLASIDPHRIDDAACAIFADALFDTLYVRDDAAPLAPSGTLAPALPSLAASDPEPSGTRLRVTLRSGLKSAWGRPIEARDVIFSLARARQSGARAWLADIAVPKADGPNSLVFPGRDAAKLTRALASPLTGIIPVGFVPERPDGTGPFRAERDGEGLVLRRNLNAARGPAFLDEIVVRPARDLAESLRAFESGDDDLGWLGMGLHEPRPGGRPFDAGAVGWVILRTGREAGTWDAPGIAQRLADGIPPSRLAHLALGAAWPPEQDDGWGGAPCDLIVRDDAPWLGEVARAVVASLTRPSHDVTARFVPHADFVQRRTTRSFALALDVARPLCASSLGTLAGLASADNAADAADLIKHPPRGEAPARTYPRTMRIGIIGEVRVQGGRVADLSLAASGGGGIDFGAMARPRRTS